MQHINYPPQITLPQFEDCVDGILTEMDALVLEDLCDAVESGGGRDLLEFETRATGLKGWDYAGYVVGN